MGVVFSLLRAGDMGRGGRDPKIRRGTTSSLQMIWVCVFIGGCSGGRVRRGETFSFLGLRGIMGFKSEVFVYCGI